MKKFFFTGLCSFVFLSTALAQSLRGLEEAPNKSGRIKQLKIKSLSDLQQLTPYESVSVIQKRYLPKTFRGELNFSITSVINHTFFYLFGASARAGFFIREDHGLGLEGFVMSPSLDKQVTDEMINPPNEIVPLGAAALSQLYGGIYYKWSPVFGKFAVLNQKIIYFDMYMTLGAGYSRVVNGLSATKQKLEKEGRLLEGVQAFPELAKDMFPSFNISVGQVFSLTQDWAFNWELKWIYSIIQYKAGTTYTPTDIYLSLGINYYFPEAGYR